MLTGGSLADRNPGGRASRTPARPRDPASRARDPSRRASPIASTSRVFSRSPRPEPTLSIVDAAETTFGNVRANLQIGVESNRSNSFQDIGFGYVGNGLQHKPPAVIAYEQTDAGGETMGDLVFGTRSSTSGAGAATQQIRLRSNGTVEVETNLQVDSTSVFNDDATFEAAVTVKGSFTTLGGYDMSADITMTKTSTGIFHVADADEYNGLNITSENGFVQVESVRFTGDNIGLSNDVDILTLTSDGTTGDVALRGTMSVSDDVTLTKDAVALTHNGSTSLAISSESGYVSITADGSYVDVESVRFTGDNIGLSNDVDILTLTSDGTTGDVALRGTMSVSDDVTLTKDAVALTHNGSTSLAISSESGYVSITADGSYVDVESVRFTGDNIGLSNDVDILTLTSDGTTGDVALRGTMSVSDDVTLTKDAVALTHNGSTSLAISSESGYVSITADGSYVDVESVRFTGDNIGLSNDVDILTLTSDGTTGDVALRGTMSVSDDVTLTKDAVALTHNGSTSLAISSESGYVSITADGSYVDVESVRFTGDNIGLSNDVDILTLTSDGTTGDVALRGTMSVSDDVTLTKDAVALTHNGSTSLAISSESGYVSITADGSYVDVESVRFTGDNIGLSNDVDILTLTSDGTTGDVALRGTMSVSDDVTLTKDAVALTHNGSTSLAISSESGYVSITADGSYVDVESVRFTGTTSG